MPVLLPQPRQARDNSMFPWQSPDRDALGASMHALATVCMNSLCSCLDSAKDCRRPETSAIALCGSTS